MSLNKKKGGNSDSLDRWVKTMISAPDHMRLKVLALDRGVSLTKLLREIIETFLHKEK